MTQTVLKFRPHHFLCSLGYQGKGYSDAFTANMTGIVVETLRAPGGGDQVIEVVSLTDDICTPCPKRRGTQCTSQEKISALDRRHARALGLRRGDRLTWAQARNRIRETVPPGSLSKLCNGCQWLELGLCEAALSDLHEGAE